MIINNNSGTNSESNTCNTHTSHSKQCVHTTEHTWRNYIACIHKSIKKIIYICTFYFSHSDFKHNYLSAAIDNGLGQSIGHRAIIIINLISWNCVCDDFFATLSPYRIFVEWFSVFSLLSSHFVCFCLDLDAVGAFLRISGIRLYTIVRWMFAVKNCYRDVGFLNQQTIPAQNFRHLIRFDSKQKRIYGVVLSVSFHYIYRYCYPCPCAHAPCLQQYERDPYCLNDTLVAFHYFICLLSHFSATIPIHLSLVWRAVCYARNAN